MNPLLVFTAYLAGLRLRHPGLRQRTYADAELGTGHDVTYLFSGISYDVAPGPADRSLSVLIDCSAVGEAGDLLVLVNMADEEVTYTLPPTGDDFPWRRIIDTGSAFEKDGNHWAGRTGVLVDGSYTLGSWSIAVCANPKS